MPTIGRRAGTTARAKQGYDISSVGHTPTSLVCTIIMPFIGPPPFMFNRTRFDAKYFTPAIPVWRPQSRCDETTLPYVFFCLFFISERLEVSSLVWTERPEYLSVVSRSSKLAGLNPGHYFLYPAGDSPDRDYGYLCTRRETLLAAAISISARGGRPFCPRLFARRDGKVFKSLFFINQSPPLCEILKNKCYDTADRTCAGTMVNEKKRPPTAVPPKSAGARAQHRCTPG